MQCDMRQGIISEFGNNEEPGRIDRSEQHFVSDPCVEALLMTDAGVVFRKERPPCPHHDHAKATAMTTSPLSADGTTDCLNPLIGDDGQNDLDEDLPIAIPYL